MAAHTKFHIYIFTASLQENPLWVDEDLQRVLDDPTNADNRQLFFAKVLRSATDDEVRRLFSRFGRGERFRAATKGHCGKGKR